MRATYSSPLSKASALRVWAPAWWCAVRAVGPSVLRRRFCKLVEATWARPDGFPLRYAVRFGPDAVEVRGVADMARYDKAAVHSLLETPEQIVVLARSTAFPIPKQQLDTGALDALRHALAAWGYPPPKVQPKPFRAWGWAVLAATLAALGYLGVRSSFPPQRSPAIAVRLANQLVGLAGGPVTLSNATFELYANGTTNPRVHLGGAIRTPNLTGWADVEADWRGFTTLTPEQDMLGQGRTIPADAKVGALPNHGAVETWTRRDGDEPPQACAATRTYLEAMSPGVYRRNVFVTACSPTLSHEELAAWEKEAVPGLGARLAPLQVPSGPGAAAVTPGTPAIPFLRFREAKHHSAERAMLRR